ncbi:class I SAM-dependent methyltransferase [Endothiovibrio diazotrophicus]
MSSSQFTERFLAGPRGAIPFLEEQLALLVRLAGGGRAPRRFLDLGCGDGLLGAVLLDAFPEAEGFLLDRSQLMLGEAGMALAPFGGRANLLHADFSDPSWCLQLPAGGFDLIVSGFTFHHYPDSEKRTLYGELFQLLEPGGLFLNLDRVAAASGWTAELWDQQVIEALHRQSGGLRSREAVEAGYRGRSDVGERSPAPVEAQCAWLRETGFHDVECFFKYLELALFGGRRP